MNEHTSPPTPAANEPAAAPAPDTETRILDAARVVFTRAGTAGARMQDIAAEAGVNQALLHYYFRSKQALADRVFRDAAATLFTALPKALRPEASLEELLRSVVHAYIDTMRRTPFLPGYLMAEAHHDPGRFAEVIAAVTGADPRGVAAQVVARIQAQIDARAAAGEMRAVRAEQLMISVMSLLAFPFVARGVLAGVYAMDDAAFERFLDARRDDLPRFLLNAVRP